MPDSPPKYTELSHFYESCLERHGPCPQGVDWPNSLDLKKRFRILLELIRDPKRPYDLLDLGCGYGELINFINASETYSNLHYTGLDISSLMITQAKQLFPHHAFITQDILITPLLSESYDYIVMNGILTEKRNLSFNEMETFAKQLIRTAYDACRVGLAFNVMNYHVDYYKDELFYWPFDQLAAFLYKNNIKNYVFRTDYGLYEYICYLYK